MKRFLRTIDPRIKMIAIVIVLVIIATSRSSTLSIMFINAFLCLCLFAFTSGDMWSFLYRFGFMFSFICFAAFFQIVLPSGVIGVTISSEEGHHPFFYLLSTIVCGISLGAFFSSTTDPVSFTDGLRRLGLSERATWLLSLAFRYVPLLRDDALQTFQAARLRGMTSSTRHIREYGALVTALTVRVFERALRTGDAMQLRGFTLQKRSLPPDRVAWSDYVILLLPAPFLMVRIL